MRPAAPAFLSRTGSAFAVVAFIEAFAWAGLLIGMFFKCVAETTV